MNTRAPPSRGASNEISFIVERLNDILKQSFTLFSFDELSGDGRKLLHVFNELLASLSPLNNVDISKEQPEQTITRIRDFLITVLGMKQLKEEDPYVVIILIYN